MTEQMPCGVTDDYDHDEDRERKRASYIAWLADHYYEDEILAMMEEADEA